ncbi:endonuclease/exonuclease/phosphatase family protein [Gilvimarinus agarilyticus]|uniref:endonuclease/exonuclease/phosphatase family protein n=1 Tax=unclassified Gilvimarinus TaxID=2642066 RepID=UPI001C0833CD|nr:MULTISPECIES: endonuclease/exonuclease/phosphatase family protein [unclassified Gilvimarinus]MBU2886269.1 endonuclease/exonuclease/phosphatase family protein [Gilvimarinus agarilyticus]MDO6570957.1 endonuclease/exonuclease/phosphatase family protein [Gilvimarinus sp. 2_MG-2023]MDO6747756.1 endonuclease/exonuclease/phosphatase family protein [Gilvimarinus sp. 1_MG-2023]
MTELKVLTVNIHKGFSSFNQRFVLHELREAAREVSADLVFLQEVIGQHDNWAKRHSGKWPTETQYEFLADTLWPSYAYGRNAVYQQGHHGNALLSKYSIVHWENYDATVGKLEERGLLHCHIDLPDNKRLHAICVHLSLRENDRQIQLAQINELVSRIPKEESVIVAGDFNDWRQKSQKILSTEAGFEEVYISGLGAPPKTFPAFFPMLRLDRIYVRSVQEHHPITMPKAPWNKLSDHTPLLANIKI